MTFSHLHTLSLNWHLSKKTGSVMKSMDRGIDGVGSLITYLFLFLIPALAECLAVVVLFFAEYKQWSLGLIVLGGVLFYSIATIAITQWRKKFREATNKHDNDFHDKATDSIINFETVKYFTAEDFEVNRFKESVAKFQVFSSSTTVSLSVLNMTQQLILNASMLGAMIVSGQAVIRGEMTLGGWIAVQSWVATIFVPLNFLGSVYASIVQSLIDIRNLSELLSELPDIVDVPGAQPIPIQLYHESKSGSTSIDFSSHDGSSKFSIDDDQDDNEDMVEIPLSQGVEMVNTSNPIHAIRNKRPSFQYSKGVSVDFENVSFNYPGQPKSKGLRGVSFHVAPGTTTAIVGHTGSGKTTISRLLFRFYEPREGSISLGGYDIRQYTQKSVRGCIGIVPQDTVLFNGVLTECSEISTNSNFI
jgi:ABC-type transport system involved in Fe-S cluster assembly fused permease/ATPase subunit